MKFKPSILRNLLMSFLAFGLFMGIIFPFYADFFVTWNEGMKTWFVLGCLVAGSMIGVSNYFLCRYILLNKLKRISQVSTAISNGDLSLVCNMKSHDLIGEIIDSFNFMAKNLREMIGQISESAQVLESDIQQMSDNFSKTQLGMSEQEVKTQQIDIAIHDLETDAQEISQKANNAREMSSEVKSQANESAFIATQAIGSISALSNSVEKTTAVIQALEEKSNEIGVVIDVIRGIAEQTNLLALNAAIEAARAGEQGRGFAVVADEVRTLATRTQESTLQIESIINELQNGSKEAVKVMNNAKTQSLNTEENFENAAIILSEIAAIVDSISETINHFSETANKQTHAVHAVFNTISEIKEVGQQTINNTSESANTCQSVQEEGVKLRGLVGKFQL
jgi:methyl-accepting chemotaxis protein